MICACDSELFYFEDLAKKQKRIFPMGIDVGYVYAKEEIPTIQAAIRELRKVYEHTFKKYGDNFSGGWVLKMFIGFEKDGDHYNGVLLTINGCYTKKYGEEIKFLTIRVRQATNPDSGYKK